MGIWFSRQMFIRLQFAAGKLGNGNFGVYRNSERFKNVYRRPLR